MTLQPIPSEFPYIYEVSFFSFLSVRWPMRLVRGLHSLSADLKGPSSDFNVLSAGRQGLSADLISTFPRLKGLSHEIDFKNVDQNLKNLA
jgi:hypothetical protein